MLGHKWEQAEGIIIEARSGHPTGRGAAAHPERHYIIEVRRPTGEVVRGHVSANSMFAHQVGEVVRIEVNAKTSEIRLDPSDGPLRAADAGDGMNPAGRAIRSGGQDAAWSDDELTNLNQLIHSGDPIARHAAVERLRQIRAERDPTLVTDPAAREAAMERIRERPAERSGHAGTASVVDDAGFTATGAPSTFDPIGATGAGNTFGEPVHETFSQPVVHSSPSQLPEPTSFGAPATVDQFGLDGGAGTREQRLAKLQQLLDRGILTESEFRAKRQQLPDGG
jgi:hypothetical protein